MPVIIVTNNPKDDVFSLPGVTVVSAKDYLILPEYSNKRDLHVINHCRSYSGRTDGYYVSLLSAARGHTVLPSVRTIHETKSLSLIKRIVHDIDDSIQKTLSHIQQDRCTFTIYFGKTVEQELSSLGMQLFKLFPASFLRADFIHQKEKWKLQNITILSFRDIPDEHLHFAVSCAEGHLSAGIKPSRRRSVSNYSLAILFDEKEKVPPSDPKAIEKFESAARKVGFNVEIIGKEDFDRIPEFDALFIRETTNVNHHTFRFSQRAEAEGLVVIDDPISILRCTNKVYLAERLSRYGIPSPETVIISRESRDTAIRKLGFPTILKEPDGSFSQGVMKASNLEEFRRKSDILFEKSDLIIAQEFVPTEYDWRIGIIDNTVLYACRYYMAKAHWQIVNWQGKGGVRVGKWDGVPLDEVPPIVIKTALKAAKVIGSSLYGVDLKLIDKNCYIIEVNDNPSIETGVEDILLKDELYRKIMQTMYNRVRMNKEGAHAEQIKKTFAHRADSPRMQEELVFQR